MHGIAKKYRRPGMTQVNSRGCSMAAVIKLKVRKLTPFKIHSKNFQLRSFALFN